MPLYEYRCRNCEHQFEVQQSFSDDPLTICPECQGTLRKVFSPVGITFKGSGFYKNDSRSPNGSSDGPSEKSSSGGSSSSESTNSSGDSKSDSSTKSDTATTASTSSSSSSDSSSSD